MNKENRPRGLLFVIGLVGLCLITFASCLPLNDFIINDVDLITEEDKVAIIRLTLERALIDKEIPDYELIKDNENIILSTANIDANLVVEIPGTNLILLTPDKIQEKADREGDFLYLRFEPIEMKDSEVIVSLSNNWAVSKDSENLYLSGGGFRIEYQKIDGKWVGRVALVWMS